MAQSQARTRQQEITSAPQNAVPGPAQVLQDQLGNGFIAEQVARGLSDPAQLARAVVDQSPARPLANAAALGESLGGDLSGVKAHYGVSALEAMGLDAVALGEDQVAFASGSPSAEQQGHEAAHLVQSQHQPGQGQSRRGDSAEREADRAGDAFAQGEGFEVSGGATGEVQGSWLGDVWSRVREFFSGLFGGGEDGGQQDGGQTTDQTGGTTDQTGGTTDTAPPELDLAPYEWLLALYAGAGLTRQQAEALLQTATDAQRALITAPPEAEATPQDGDIPDASLDEHAANRARPLDWGANPRAGHLSPETPEGQTGQVGGQTLGTTFTQHRDALFAEEFGAGVTLLQVRGAIAFADAMAQPDVASGLRARLFRVNQYAVVESLNVEDSGRYQPGGGSTYCNIYAYDVVTALGAYIPRTWWYDAVLTRIQNGEEAVSQSEYERRVNAGEPVTGLIRPEYGVTVREMNANSLNTWMRTYGDDFGWTEATNMTAAQDAANGGKVVVVLASNANPSRSGHITVVLAETDEHTAARDDAGEVRAPLQSQAGASNFKHRNNDAGEGRDQWWENNSHVDGAAWINSGSGQSPIVTPESLGR